MKISRAALALWLFSIPACNYKVDKQSGENSAEQVQPADLQDPDFCVVMAKVIRPKCLECHSAAGGNLGGLNLESHQMVVRALAQARTAIESGSMPKNRAGLTGAQKALILTWMQTGAPEIKSHRSVVQDEPLTLDYKTVNHLVIESACVLCHSAQRTEGKVRLESFADVVVNLKKIGEQVESGAMPKRGTLSETQRDLILAWIASGAPETSSQILPAQKIPVASAGDDRLKAPALDQEFLNRGKYLFGLASCATCHTVDPLKPLAGGKSLDTPFGTFFSPNISADLKTGIGLWSAADFLKALREGIGPKGKRYFPSFPFTNYSKLSDEDLLSIRAYIFSLPSTPQENRPHILSFPYDQRWLLSFWRLNNFPSVENQTEKNFKTAAGPFQEITSRSLAWNRGAYLVEGPLHCTVCHTPRGELGGLIVNKWFSGSVVSGGSLPAPNITPENETGLKNWSARDWHLFLNEGVTPRGDKVGGEMWRVIREATSTLTANDQAAVIEYMMAVRPVKNRPLAEQLRKDHPERATPQ